jgi:hypothetical protein
MLETYEQSAEQMLLPSLSIRGAYRRSLLALKVHLSLPHVFIGMAYSLHPMTAVSRDDGDVGDPKEA